MPSVRVVRKKYSIDEIKTLLEPVFRKHHVKRAVLFGSYSCGRASKTSDVDIMVESPLRGLEFFALLEDVVSTLQKEVDLIEMRQLTEKSSFKDNIDHNGVEIYAA